MRRIAVITARWPRARHPHRARRRRLHPAATAAAVALLAVLAAVAAGLGRGRPATAGGATILCGDVPTAAAVAAALAHPSTQPRGPLQWRPDPAAFQAVLQRTGATVEMARFTTNYRHAVPSQEANIALTAKRLTGHVIQAGAVFSYNGTVGPYTEANGYGWGRMFVGDRIVPTIGGGVCQGASTLYNVVLMAGLPVVERHRHALTVPYLAPGRDATVTDSAGLDFRFRNDTGRPLVLWAEAVDRQLTVAMYGARKPPPVTIESQVLARYPFRTEYINDPKLPAGKEQVVAPGQQGVLSQSWLVVQTPSGPERRPLTRDRYRPSPRIVRRGTGRQGSAG